MVLTAKPCLAHSDHSGPVTFVCALGKTVSPPSSTVVLFGRSYTVGMSWQDCYVLFMSKVSRQSLCAMMTALLPKGYLRRSPSENLCHAQLLGDAQWLSIESFETHRYIKTVAVRCPPFAGLLLYLPSINIMSVDQTHIREQTNLQIHLKQI